MTRDVVRLCVSFRARFAASPVASFAAFASGAASTLLLYLLLAVLPVAARAEAGESGGAPGSAAHELLIMLRLPPPHFRPDAGYAGGYAAQSGSAGRHRIAEDLAARFKLRIVDNWPMPALGVVCFVMEASDDAPLQPLIDRMALDARVESVQAVNLFRVLAHDDALYPLQPTATAWRLDEIHRLATGRNVRVAAIDSGVELDHPDLRGRISISRNFVDAREAVAEMHGTAVAGIIGARADNGVGIVGVAPDAQVMALRACWQDGRNEGAALCSSFTLAKALQFAIDNGAKVINLSLGGPRDRLVERLLAAAAARGAVIVAASDPRAADGGFPASLPGVLAVAADDVHDAPEAVYLAPGRDIPTTLPGARWGLVGGSSYAAAQMSGLVALLVDLAPDQSTRQLRETLSTSDRAGASSRSRTIVDACAAVARTVGACACGCTFARSSVATPVH
jgi:hypothetical protein